MMDLERLDEALDALVVFAEDDERLQHAVNHDDLMGAVEAARAYRDLLANGERVEWCEVHRHEGFDSEHEPGWVCESGEWVEDEGRWDCRIVSRLLVDPPKEEER